MAKKLKWNLILMSVLYLALGVFLLLVPGTALNVVCYALGAVVLVCARSSVMNMTFLGIVFVNTVIGCFQEIRAKRAVDKLTLVAPRAGRVDSLPYKLGDQPGVGAPLVVLLVGEAPHARVYLPQALRNRLAVGDRLRVQIQPAGQVFDGRVRMIRSDPVFTPYFALTGQDTERLSYLAEVVLDKPADLPAGVPVRVEFAGVGDGK